MSLSAITSEAAFMAAARAAPLALPRSALHVLGTCDSTMAAFSRAALTAGYVKSSGLAGSSRSSTAAPMSPRLLVTAHRQTAGRGRYGRDWVSPEGCLAVTWDAVLPQACLSALPLIQHAAGLAVHQGIQQWVRSLPGVPPGATVTGVKWPNDVWAIGDDGAPTHKVAGVLVCTESTTDGLAWLAGIGVGVNVAGTEPWGSVVQAAGLAEQAAWHQPEHVARAKAALLACIIAAWRQVWPEFWRGAVHSPERPFAHVQAAYLAAWLHTGQRVLVKPKAGAPQHDDAAARLPQQGVHMTVRGLASSGELVGEDERGTAWRISADSGSLDMLDALYAEKAL